MATSVKPESVVPAPTGTPVPTAEELASRQTPQTNSPPAPVTKEPTKEEKIIAAQEAVIRDMQRNNAELTQRQRNMEERIKVVEAGPLPTVDEQNKEFWHNPVGLIKELIQGEMNKTVGPLNELLTKRESRTEYDLMKDRFRTEYGTDWTHIEKYVDEFVDTARRQGLPVNEQLLDVAALSSYGAYKRGRFGDVASEAAPTPTTVTAPVPPTPPVPASRDMNPPHLRPSAPVPPGHEREQAPTLRDLTENEARLARERGMSKEQYLSWIEVRPESVIHSMIGKQETPK